MTEAKKSVQKVKYEKFLEENKGERGHKFGLQYVRTDVDNPKAGMRAYKLASSWTPEEKAFVKALSVGDELVLTKVEREYTDKEGSVRSSWDIETVADVKSWQPKPAAAKKWEGKKTNWTPSDNLSAKVGGLIHDAVAMHGVGVTVSQVGQTVRELLREAYAIEAEASTGVFKKNTSPPATSTKTAKPVVEEPEEFFDNIDSVEW